MFRPTGLIYYVILDHQVTCYTPQCRNILRAFYCVAYFGCVAWYYITQLQVYISSLLTLAYHEETCFTAVRNSILFRGIFPTVSLGALKDIERK